MMNQVSLTVEGKEYSGFTGFGLEDTMQSLSKSFTFDITQKTEIDQAGKPKRLVIPIKKGQKCEIKIDSKLVTTGFVDAIRAGGSASSHGISISGMDKTADLVDTSALPKVFTEREFNRLIRSALKINGFSDINVVSSFANLPLGSTNPQSDVNDKIFDFLARYAEQAQVLLTSDEKGDLVIVRESTELMKGVLVRQFDGEKNNVLEGSLEMNDKDRFGTIIIMSQGENTDFSAADIGAKFSVNDAQIRSQRRIIIPVTTPTPSSYLRQMAEWERRVRKAKGNRLTYQVAGFYAGKDELYQKNRLIKVTDELLEVDGVFLIESVSFAQSGSGSFSNLSLVERGSYDIRKPLPAKASTIDKDWLPDA